MKSRFPTQKDGAVFADYSMIALAVHVRCPYLFKCEIVYPLVPVHGTAIDIAAAEAAAVAFLHSSKNFSPTCCMSVMSSGGRGQI